MPLEQLEEGGMQTVFSQEALGLSPNPHALPTVWLLWAELSPRPQFICQSPSPSISECGEKVFKKVIKLK